MTASAPARAADSPFLSVLVPTDGTMLQALRESMLGLFGQDDGDFEVLVVAAGLSERTRAELQQVVAEQPPFIACRLRVVETQGTTPGAIRNAGLELSEGRYAVVLVPGDVPLGCWVRTFHTGAQSSPPAILRAQGLTQRHAYGTMLGHPAVRAEGPPRAESPATFSLWQHALEAVSLPGSWAWPRTSADQPSVSFDEAITDDADHELLVRLAEGAGVLDLAEVSIIHHEWSRPAVARPLQTGGPRAQDVLDQRPLLLPPGEARAIATSLPEPESTISLHAELARLQAELRLTHDHATNLETMVDSLQQQREEAERKHAKRVARLKEKLAALQTDSTGADTARVDRDARAEGRSGVLRLPGAKGRSRQK